MSLRRVEFYNYLGEVWLRDENGNSRKLEEKETGIIATLLDKVQQFYPKAYSALAKEYSRCEQNQSYYRYKMACRFCRCNFGNIDSVPDINNSGKLNLEEVPCPLRGECIHEGVICKPSFNSQISPAEKRVLELVYRGATREEIAQRLYLSLHTVNNHIRNAFVRLGIHEKAEFMKWAADNKIFKDEL